MMCEPGTESASRIEGCDAPIGFVVDENNATEHSSDEALEPSAKRIKVENMSDTEEKKTSLTTAFPSHIAEILEVVFKNFSNQELMNLRKVSKDWNTEACRQVILSPWPVNKPDGVEFFHSKKCIQLFNLLNDSLNPGILLKEIQISSCLCENDLWTMYTESTQKTGTSEMQPNQNPFQAFGDHVKRLKIKQDQNFELLKTFVVQRDAYCPELETLDYYAWGFDISHAFLPPKYRSKLNLKELRFSMCNQVALLDSILGICPQLSCLHITCHNAKAMKSFCKRLQSLHFVAHNLTNLSIDSQDFSHLKELVKCHFSKNLKKLKLHYYLDSSQDLYENKHSSETDLMSFLKRLASSLEELTIDVTEEPNSESESDEEEDGQDEDEQENNYISYPNSLEDLPSMSSLKVLSLKHCVVAYVEELCYLKKVPSLKILNIRTVNNADLTLVDLVKDFLQSECVHNQLELFQFEEDNDFMRFHESLMIPSLNQTFPKLTKVWISTMEYPSYRGPYENPFDFFEAFDALSKMDNLKVLEMDLSSVGYRKLDEKRDLTPAFRCLKKAPKLEKLIFFHKYGPLFKFPKKKWLLELLDAPKLRIVQFYGFSMNRQVDFKSSYGKIDWELCKRQPEGEEDDDWFEEDLPEDVAQAFEDKNIELFIKLGKPPIDFDW